MAHNLQNYDLHHVIRALNHCEPTTTVNVIPQSDEKFISLSLGVLVTTYERIGKPVKVFETLRFIDSFKFMSTSLEGLVSNLPENSLGLLDEHFAWNPEHVELLHQKGFYPYSYMSGPEKFDDVALPPISEWKNTLAGEQVTISTKDYEHAQKIFTLFGCKNMRDYHNLYLAVDTLQLACVVEHFREATFQSYGLDAAQYFSASNISGDAFLKISAADVELITERNHLEMAENLKRGGLATVYSSRMFIANNRHSANFNPELEETYGFMIDANNLYGGIMETESLPLNSFSLIEGIELSEILQTSPDSEFGYILEVDLKYPTSLHNLHATFMHQSQLSSCSSQRSCSRRMA